MHHSEKHTLRIGTRGSKLALVQTNLVIEALKKLHPELEIETKIITTKGDVNQSPIPLDTVGKAWFTAEIEQALIDKEIDLAIHSLKDLSPEIPMGLMVLPVLKREDPRDVLVSKNSLLLKDLPHHAIIGTDSLRREALLLRMRPDLRIKSIRGNVETRVRKLREEDYDAIVIAAAGLKRIDLSNVITEFFDPALFVPAAGQGILAAEIRTGDKVSLALVKEIQDELTSLAVIAERAFSETVGGGCKLPIGCYAKIEGEEIHIHAVLGTMDALRAEVRSVHGPKADSVMLAKKLAEELLAVIPFNE